MFLFFFFFSSRRRHTRFDCDWSSDVCSSDLPFASDRGLVTEITEELEEAEVKTDTASLQRCEPPAQRVLAHDARHHELSQVAFATGLGPDSGQAMSSKGLAANQRAGDGPVDVEVAHVEGLAGCLDIRGTP